MVVQDDVTQREITRVCVKTALLLLQYGAESSVVVQMTRRLGIALGVESVEVALTANAITLTTLMHGNCITTARQCSEQGINMQVVTDVQRLIITAEHHIYDLNKVSQKLNKIQPRHYNRWLVAAMVGLACACFGHLSGATWEAFCITFIASFLAMLVRQELAKRHYNSIIIFSVTAFVASVIAGLALKFELSANPQIALASSVLLLVPGFPLINSLSDILKGYINMGLARWTIASILTLGACMGIVLALFLLKIGSWGA